MAGSEVARLLDFIFRFTGHHHPPGHRVTPVPKPHRLVRAGSLCEGSRFAVRIAHSRETRA